MKEEVLFGVPEIDYRHPSNFPLLLSIHLDCNACTIAQRLLAEHLLALLVYYDAYVKIALAQRRLAIDLL